jgi:hypothetical protein
MKPHRSTAKTILTFAIIAGLPALFCTMWLVDAYFPESFHIGVSIHLLLYAMLVGSLGSYDFPRNLDFRFAFHNLLCRRDSIIAAKRRKRNKHEARRVRIPGLQFTNKNAGKDTDAPSRKRWVGTPGLRRISRRPSLAGIRCWSWSS